MTKVKNPEVEVTDHEAEDSASMDRRGFLSTVGIGAAGLGAVASVGVLAPGVVSAGGKKVIGLGDCPGIEPRVALKLPVMPDYKGRWNCVTDDAFGGFDFAMGYFAEGIEGGDPLSDRKRNGPNSNTSGLFEQWTLSNYDATAFAAAQSGPAAGSVVAADTGQPLSPGYSGVGGNEFPERSAEFWLRDILNQSNAAIRDDLWSAINWARRTFCMDFDDPAMDGFNGFGVPYQYPGSPDANNEYSLLSARYAGVFDKKGNVTGWARMAYTLLGPETSYTVVFRKGKKIPNYNGKLGEKIVAGTPALGTSSDPNCPGKVRDGGFWGGVVEPMDCLPDIQAARRGKRYFTTPTHPHPPLSGTTPPGPHKRGSYAPATNVSVDAYGKPLGVTPEWGQFWRRPYEAVLGLDMDDPKLLQMFPSIDAVKDNRNHFDPGNIPGTSRPARPAGRPDWPVGFLARGTDLFWGNYNLFFGPGETSPDPSPTGITLHYQSEVPTSFRPADGIPETFVCDLCPNPGSVEIKARPDMDVGTGIALFDSYGGKSGFPDVSNPELDGQMTFGAPNFYGRVHGTSYPRSLRSDGVTIYHFRNYLTWPPTLNGTVLGDPLQDNFGNINWTIPTHGDFAAPVDKRAVAIGPVPAIGRFN